jgi:asparagine synthase (glutamine-hydrolysing)
MCGILGIVQMRNTISLDAIEAGRDVVTHRGPDGHGIWYDDLDDGVRVALAHRRLSIIDLSARGAQPLLTTCSGDVRPAREREQGGARFALTYNGEIYNYRELRDELRGMGHRFSSDCDTEVLLRSYEQWGAACLKRFNGMFAFALWDRQNQELLCARDRFGEKPFHYLFDPAAGVFAFASEVKSLVRAGLARAEFDDRAVYRYLRFGEQAGVSQTIWRDVHRLSPAHLMRVAPRAPSLAIETRPYWKLDLTDECALSEAEQVERFRELFRESVSLRLRADVPVGTGLSGGVDSSSVVCQIRELGFTTGQQTFTAQMDDPALDESAHADLVAKVANVDAHTVTPSGGALIDELDSLFLAQEEPFPSTSMFASYLVNRLARDHGVVVLLDGQGADEYLAGYAHYPALILSQLARRGSIREWWNERQAIRRRVGIDPVPPRAMLHYLTRRNANSELPVDGNNPTSYLRAEFARIYATEEGRRITIRRSPLKTRLFADLMLGHLQELLRYADRNSMHFSREVRLPFLDHRLVEFTMSLPDDRLFRRGESKWILRQAMRGIVPDPILDRRDKIGFATPWRQWWTGGVGHQLGELLADSERSLADYVTPGTVRGGTSAALSLIGLARVKAGMLSLR